MNAPKLMFCVFCGVENDVDNQKNHILISNSEIHEFKIIFDMLKNIF